MDFKELHYFTKKRGEKMFKRLIASALICAMVLSVAPFEAKANEEKTVVTGKVNSITNEEPTRRVVSSVKKVNDSFDKDSYGSVSEAGKDARDKIYNHYSKVVMKVKSKSKEPQTLFDSIESVIYAETDNVNQGDYMKWDVDESETSFSYIKIDGYYYYTFTSSMSYLTSLTQRNTLDKKVDELIQSFKFTNTTNTYTKIKTTYDYICKNTKYASSKSNVIVYSAYSALINKKAVCQGYASLLYKVLRTMGLSTRVIAGQSTFSGETHGWNIVKLGSYYYNVDSTWDSSLYHKGKKYSYFLKGDSFSGHQRWNSYNSYAFYEKYPMAAGAYGSKTANKPSTKNSIIIYKKKKPKIKSITRKKVKFKKVAGSKYQVAYSSTSTFVKKKTKYKRTKKKSYKFKKLKSGVRYFVKFRAYKKIGGANRYTKWSDIKTI